MGETPSSKLMCSGSVVRIASRLEKEHENPSFLEKSTAYHLRARSVPGSAEPLSFTNRYTVAQYVSGPLKHRPFRSIAWFETLWLRSRPTHPIIGTRSSGSGSNRAEKDGSGPYSDKATYPGRILTSDARNLVLLIS